MMLIWFLIGAICASVYGSPLSGSPQHPIQQNQRQVNNVFMLSLDGFQHEYLERADELNLRIPNLRRLMREGSFSHNVSSVYPSVTYPSHTTMITGVTPDKHGVHSNTRFDPMRQQLGLSVFHDQIKVKTLFDVVHSLGRNTSAIEWPVTAFSQSIDHSKPDFPWRSAVEKELIFNGCRCGDIVKSSIPSIEALKAVEDKQRMEMAIRIITETSDREYPALQALHLIDFDHAQHTTGTFTQHSLDTLEVLDSQIGQVLDALERRGTLDSTYFLLVADHGFTNITQFIAPSVLLASQDLIAAPGQQWKLSTNSAPGIYAIYINPALADDVKSDAEVKVNNIVRYLTDGLEFGITAAHVGYEQVQSANLNGFPGAFAVLESRNGVVFSDATTGSLLQLGALGTYKATHGYNPANADMKTNFIIRGSDVKKNFNIGAMNLLQVAPTVAKIMGLKMPHVMDGNALDIVFENS